MKKFLSLSILTILLLSCKHDLENLSWEVDMIVPIAHSNMNISDMITEVNSDYILKSDKFIRKRIILLYTKLCLRI